MKRKKFFAIASNHGVNPAPPGQTWSLRWMFASLWTFCVLIMFFSQNGRMQELSSWEAFFDLLTHVPAIFLAGLGWHILQISALWFLFVCVGNLIVRWLRLTGMTRIEHLLISAGIGAGTISLVLLGLGITGLWQPAFLRGIFYVSAGSCLVQILLNMRRRHGEGSAEQYDPGRAPTQQERPGILQGVALGFILLAVVMNVLATAAPVTSYDALVYHLALPKLFLLRGQITPTPENLYSGIPFGIQMLYGLTLALANENLASLLLCSFGVFTALAIWALLRRHASNYAGVLAALFYYLCPLVLYGSWQSGIDLGGGFYLTLALTALSLGLQTSRETESRAWPVATGIFLGLAMGVKYTFLPIAGAFVLVVFWLRRRSGNTAALKEAAMTATIAAVVFMPWLIKNLFFYGNPVYPFFNNFLGWVSPADWKGFLVDAHSRNLAQTFGSVFGWKGFLSQPWTMSINSRGIDDWPGLLFLMFIPWALCLRWGISEADESNSPAWTAIAVLAMAGYLVWSLTSEIARFLVMALPFASCLAALAIVRAPIGGWFRHAIWGLVLLPSTYNFLVTFKMGMEFASGRWPQLIGIYNRSTYLKQQHMGYGAPHYAAMEYINQNLPPDAKVLFIGEPRTFYCERDFVAATVFDNNPFWVAAGEAKTAEDLLASARKLGITHIFVNAISLYSYSDRPAVMPRDIIAGKIFNDFWNYYTEQLFENISKSADGKTAGWLTVYKLRDRPNDDPGTFPQNPSRAILETVQRQSQR